MTETIMRRLGRFGVGLLTALLVVGLAAGAYAAPTEVDIGASTPPPRPVRHAPRPTPLAEPARQAQPSEEAAPVSPPAEPALPAESSSSAENPSGDTSDTATAPPSGLISQPRATFPYTVKSGDTLGTIAGIFGVSVADLMRVNRLRADTELSIGETVRVPNPFLARERELSSEIDRLSSDKQAASDRAQHDADTIAGLHARVQDLTESNNQDSHQIRMLPWWRAAMLLATGAAVLMLGVMIVALFEWWILRSRFRAVAEMNESLRRLDYKYKAALGKAELRLQELYGRRRRGIQDGQERAKIPEEAEIEQLSRQLKEVLERHLERLGPPSDSARRARWRERVAGIGSPVEARSIRR
jgi:LysM repeat protein